MDFPGPSAAAPRATVARLPLGPGVYRFRDAAGRVLYVGRAVCLRRRVASYWGDLGDRSRSGGQEAEVWIRLSQSADSPGVAVARRPRSGDRARYFGSYLGGQKARHAVSGLGRVLPLGPAAYWATDPPAGTGRELARARGRPPSPGLGPGGPQPGLDGLRPPDRRTRGPAQTVPWVKR